MPKTQKPSNLPIIICAVVLGVLFAAHLFVLATQLSGQAGYGQQSPLPLVFLLAEFIAVVVLVVFAFKAIALASKTVNELDSGFQAATRYLKDGRTDISIEQMVNELCMQLSEYRRTARELVDRAVDVICVINVDGHIASVNKACQSAWGYAQSDLEGKPLSALFETEEANRVMGSVLGATRSIDKIVFESKVRRKDGGLVDVIWTGHWSVREKGFFCIVHDISQQKQLERMKTEFIAMVTHDIRAPLATVEGVLSLMEHGVLGEISDKGVRIAQGTRKECQRLLRLLNDMLQLDKIDAGSFTLECNQFNLAEVAKDAVESATSAAEGRGVKLQLESADAPCWCDEIRISQVLLNLLSNAIKYAPEGSTVAVKVTTTRDTATVQVTDRGRGIPPEKLERIFERFEQVSSSDSREKQGTGLGLAICKLIVNQHGGEIGVNSKIDEGSTFWFSVPVNPQAIPDKPEAAFRPTAKIGDA